MEWSTRWEEVKKTMVRGLHFAEEIMHRRVYKDTFDKIAVTDVTNWLTVAN